MSVQMMGAVINAGPQDRTQFCVLLALANYADDFGFAFPSIETIASNSRCDERTTRRMVMSLEAEGWLYCVRKAVNGKSNAYILNMGKMGVTAPRDGKRSPLFLRLYKTFGDTMTPIFAPEKSEDIATFSEDNSQPLRGQNGGGQRTFEKSQRTFEGGSEDIACPPNLKNHSTYLNRQEPSGTKSTIEPPTLPSRREGDENGNGHEISLGDLTAWSLLQIRLKSGLCSTPDDVAKAKRWSSIKPGENDYDACFRDWWLLERRDEPDAVVLVIGAADEQVTAAGVAKYQARLNSEAKSVFPSVRGRKVMFVVASQQAGP